MKKLIKLTLHDGNPCYVHVDQVVSFSERSDLVRIATSIGPIDVRGTIDGVADALNRGLDYTPANSPLPDPRRSL